MNKRITIIYCSFMLAFSLIMIRMYILSQGNFIKTVSANQGVYKLEITKFRGQIYDCKYKPLTDKTYYNVAAIQPCIEATNALSQVVSEKEMETIFELSKKNKPFKLNLIDKDVYSKGIDVFKIPNRYSENQLATHVIGMLNGEGNGISGIEKAFNEYLKESSGNISVKYKVDALNRILDENSKIVDDTSYLKSKGVVLTIDSRLQKICEETASKYLDKGAVIITDVPNCNIKAIASIPKFSHSNIGEAINDENSPLINRAFLPYNIGSIYKLVTAATYLEMGYPENEEYDCKGYIKVENNKFHCFNGNSHKNINMIDALAYSCNTYFVNIARNLPIQKLLDLSVKFGLGTPNELAPGMISSSGNLPNEKELEKETTLANVSFGQGSLMCTPLQISELINTIASNGVFSKAKLVMGFVDDQLLFKEYKNEKNCSRVISEKTVQVLKDGMVASVEYGTSKKGKPNNVLAAAKTATAQTGIKKDDKYVIQAWYAGFFPVENPKYSVVVLAEDAVGGGESCGPVFKEITEQICNKFSGALIE